MKIISTLLFVFLLNPISDISVIKIIPVKADKLYTDGFENIYVVSESSLIKYNFDGKKLYEFDSPDREKISFIDTKNPMKILLFFENRNKMLFLDNRLSIIGDEVFLENLNIYGDVLVCSAESGGVWVVDVSNNILMKFNADYKELFQKNLFEINSEPDYLIAENNSLYIKSENNIVSVFDNLGNYNYKIDKKISADFSVNGSNIQYFNHIGNSFLSYNFETGDSILTTLPDTLKINNALQSSDYLIFNDEKKVYISKIINEKTDNR